MAVDLPVARAQTLKTRRRDATRNRVRLIEVRLFEQDSE
jgi:hypothetical protein